VRFPPVRLPPAQNITGILGQEVTPGCSERGGPSTVSPKLKKVKYLRKNKQSLFKQNRCPDQERGPSLARDQISI